MTRPRYGHQLHVWISDEVYTFLQSVADERAESVGATIRAMLRALRKQTPGATQQIARRPIGAIPQVDHSPAEDANSQ